VHLANKLTLPKGSISINGHEYASPGSLTRLSNVFSKPLGIAQFKVNVRTDVFYGYKISLYLLFVFPAAQRFKIAV